MPDVGELHRRAADARLVAAGITPQRTPRDYIVALTRQLDVQWALARREGSVNAPVKLLFDFLDASSGRLGPSANLACRKGCDFCCKLWVSVTGPEALYLARAISGTRQAEAVSRVQAARRNLKHSDRAAISEPCPFLEDHSCGAYAVRPANCRLAVSTSVEVCKRAYLEMTGEAVPIPGIFIGMGFVAQTAFAAALRHNGLPTYAYELTAAVTRAIVEPQAERRWFDGEDIFAGLERDTIDPGAGDNVKATLQLVFGQ